MGFSCCPYYRGSHQRESVIAGVYFSQTSVICFRRGFSYRPYYRGARYREVSARRELTVFALVAPVVGSSLRSNWCARPVRANKETATVISCSNLFVIFLDGTPDSTPHSLLTPTHLPQVTSPGGAVPHVPMTLPHVPMTLPRVPAHVFSGQHVLSASKFNREQVNWGRNFVLILLVIKLWSEEYFSWKFKWRYHFCLSDANVSVEGNALKRALSILMPHGPYPISSLFH